TQYAFDDPAKQPKSSAYPNPLEPIDDLPPITVITHVSSQAAGKLLVRGTCSDNGAIKRVLVNGQVARAVTPNFAEWEIVLDRPAGDMKLTAHAEDTAGNVERRPHERNVEWRTSSVK